MDTELAIVQEFISSYPVDAVRILEGLPIEDTVSLLEELPTEHAVGMVNLMDLSAATQCLEALDTDLAGAIVGDLPLDIASVFLRAMETQRSESVLGGLQEEAAASLRLVLTYPEGTAGALMDPRILSVPEDITMDDALGRVRRHPQRVMYYLYVVNADRVLVGVLTFRELMLAQPDARIGSMMHTDLLRIPARTDRLAILAHPGWLRVHALPVVDDSGRLVGAIRYETLRRIERDIEQSHQTASTRAVGAALGELYRIGLTGLVESASSMNRGLTAEGGD